MACAETNLWTDLGLRSARLGIQCPAQEGFYLEELLPVGGSCGGARLCAALAEVFDQHEVAFVAINL